MVCMKVMSLLPPNFCRASWTRRAYLLLPRGAYHCCHSNGSLGVVGLVGTDVGLATLAEILTGTLLRDSTSPAPRCLALWVTLGFGLGCTSLTLCLELLVVLLNHDAVNSLKVR
jgi:hypothetical protein